MGGFRFGAVNTLPVELQSHKKTTYLATRVLNFHQNSLQVLVSRCRAFYWDCWCRVPTVKSISETGNVLFVFNSLRILFWPTASTSFYGETFWKSCISMPSMGSFPCSVQGLQAPRAISTHQRTQSGKARLRLACSAAKQ